MSLMHRCRRFLFPPVAALAFTLAACAGLPSPEERNAGAEALAAARGWHKVVLDTAPFKLAAFLPEPLPAGELLTVYIEGDGFAWASSSEPSLDPTPVHPVGLQLALRHPGGHAVYLARPCQYAHAVSPDCDQAWWTARRFAPEVIAASSTALDALKARTGAKRLVLVGYSGGAAVAALLAARRGDVARLVTVAGNLDPRAWTAHHGLAPLAGSLDPVDEIARLSAIAQIHFVGARDSVVPPALVRAFAAHFPLERRPEVRVVPGQDHQCCWAERWPELMSGAMPREAQRPGTSAP